MAKKKSIRHHRSNRASSKPSKNTTLWILAFGVLGVGLFVWRVAYPSPTSSDINEVANVSSGTVDLVLNPSNVELQVGTEESIKLLASAGDTKLTAVQLVLSYDPDILGTPTITQGDFLSNALAAPKVENGQITATYAVAPSQGGQSELGTIMTIKIKPIQAGSATINFEEGTAVAAVGYQDNAIKSATGSQILVTANVPETVNVIDQGLESGEDDDVAVVSQIAPSEYQTPPKQPSTSKQVVAGSPAPNPSDSPTLEYSYTQEELDAKFDPAQNLTLWQKIIAFFKRIFNQ